MSRDADILVTLSTFGAYSKEPIEKLEQGVLLINMARGNMIDDYALHDAILSGHIGGAALDVFPDEPYTGPLCDNDRVIMTPHQATLTFETRINMEVEAMMNLISYLNNCEES